MSATFVNRLWGLAASYEAGPLVAVLVGQGAHLDNGQGDGEFALEGFDAAAEVVEGHGLQLLSLGFCTKIVFKSRFNSSGSRVCFSSFRPLFAGGPPWRGR